jgi:hypothetical protein
MLITDDRERATIRAWLIAHSVPREKLLWVK